MRLMKKIGWLIVFSLFLFNQALAFKLTNLYQVETAVASQTEDLKEQAIQDGFLEVLTRLSGDPNVTENRIIKKNLQKAAYYVQDYYYLLPTTSSSQYILRITYDQSDILRLLKKAGISYWQENRPLILVWLSVTDKHMETQVIGNDSPIHLLKPIKQEAEKYGLPIIFPIMDVADMGQLAEGDADENTLSHWIQASKRYAPDAILIGTLVYTDMDVESYWQLILGKQQWKWTISRITTDDVLNTLMANISQTLSHTKSLSKTA